MTYTSAELMTVVAARELRDGEVVFVGIGLPNLACNLARATHAPNLVLVYESGAVGAVPDRLPVSIGDPSLVTGSLMVCGMADVFQLLLQNGRKDAVVPKAALGAIVAAAPRGTDVRWYPAGHGLTIAAFRDQLDWLSRKLPIRGPAVAGAKTGP